MSLRKIFYAMPVGVRYFMRKLIFLPKDAYNYLTNVDQDLPSKGDIFTGAGNFRASGEKFFAILKDHCALNEDSSVLDIGSGIGRLAIPLSDFLNGKGLYEGFDIVEKGVNWCTKNISAKNPNFQFTHINLENDLYTRGGKSASDFHFPYPDEHFNVSASISVYTHMLWDEIVHYLYETRRVMKPGGISLATFFVISDENQLNVNPDFRFPFRDDEVFLMDAKVKRANVALPKEALMKLLENELGFEIVLFSKGNWNQQIEDDFLDFQDVVIFKKK